MSTKAATVRARVEAELKEETELIFDQLGISTTEAIRIFFKQVQLQKGLPFDMKVPNEVTQKALHEARTRKNLTTSKGTDQLFEDLDI
jgi:DNA-damage-inducible protein J